MWRKNNRFNRRADEQPGIRRPERNASGLEGVARGRLDERRAPADYKTAPLPSAKAAAQPSSARRPAPKTGEEGRKQDLQVLWRTLGSKRIDGAEPEPSQTAPSGEERASFAFAGKPSPAAARGPAFAPDQMPGQTLGQTPGQMPGQTPAVCFTGSGRHYLLLLLQNLLGSIATVGVYSFWGKTKLREYLWSNTLLYGEPLEYTGTGNELCKGFFIVVPAYIALSFLFALFLREELEYGNGIAAFIFFFIWQIASYKALRYRLTRTRWRGIRGGLEGNAVAYAVKATWYWGLALASLGLLYPLARARLTQARLNNVWFGDRRLAFRGPVLSLYVSYGSVLFYIALLGGLLSGVAVSFLSDLLEGGGGIPGNPVAGAGIGIFSLFLALSIYLLFRALIATAFFRWVLRGAQWGGLSFDTALGGGRAFALSLGSIVSLLLTLGLSYPWVLMARLRLYLDSVRVSGNPRPEQLLQNPHAAPSSGEGLLAALDADIGL